MVLNHLIKIYLDYYTKDHYKVLLQILLKTKMEINCNTKKIYSHLPVYPKQK